MDRSFLGQSPAASRVFAFSGREFSTFSRLFGLVMHALPGKSLVGVSRSQRRGDHDRNERGEAEEGQQQYPKEDAAVAAAVVSRRETEREVMLMEA